MLNIGSAFHDGDWNWENVVSPFMRIFLVVEGRAKVHFHDKIVTLTPKHLYIIPPHTMHSYECEGKFSLYYLHCYEEDKKGNTIFDYLDFPTEVNAESLDECIFEYMCKHYPAAELPASDPYAYDNVGRFMDYVSRYHHLSLGEKIELQGNILLLFSKFVKHAKPRVWTKDRRLSDVLSYINSHLYHTISIDELASIACVNKSYFIRLFVRAIGMSPLQFINKKKIAHAELLLITDDLPIKEIAYKLGYSEPSYFIRQFKNVTGTTPMLYRKNNALILK